MKVFVKNIKGDTYTLETSPDETTRQLKQQLQALLSLEPESMKLIHKGKHLEDERPLRDFNIADGDTIILMMLKKHTAPPLPPPVGSAPPRAESVPAQPVPLPTAAPPAAPAQPTQAQLDPSNEIVQGSMNKSRMIEELAAMGFPAGEAERALIAAFYNRDRAVDYLLSGIPETAPADDNTSTHTAAGSDQPAAPGGGELYLDAQQMAQLQQLVSTPEFENIRRHAAQNPQVLQELKGFLQQHRPELFRLFEQNPGLCEALVTGQLQMQVEGAEEPGSAAELAPAGEAPEPELGPEDRAAIAAMQAFGFSERQCVEAYLICDRNQELALNYLLDEQANR